MENKEILVYKAKAPFREQHCSINTGDDFQLGDFSWNGKATFNDTNKGPVPLDYIVNFCEYVRTLFEKNEDDDL